jgi:hypothetical protein
VVREAHALAGDVVRSALHRRLPLIAAGLLLAAVAGVVLVVSLSSHGQPSTAGALPGKQPLSASWTMSPSSVLFGDTVHVRVEATIDRRRLDPERLRLDTNFKPYEPVRPRLVTRKDVSHYTHLVYRVDLRCVVSDCAPDAGALQRLTIQPAKLVYRGRVHGGGRPPSLRLDWPVVVVFSRLDVIDLERRARGITRTSGGARQINVLPLPPWHVDSQLVPASYVVRPGTAFWIAVAAALMLIGAATVLLRPYLPAPSFLRRRRGEPEPLERALAAVESARASGAEERERKALELLGTELARSGEIKLAESARSLAWSRPGAPEPSLTAALTVDVRRLIEERSNGHAA